MRLKLNSKSNENLFNLLPPLVAFGYGTGLCAICPGSDITTNTTWTKNNVYILNGFRYVKDGATLTIEPGTVIRGDKASKGTLIIAKTGKIFANGTAAEPIVFTSNEPVGSRTYGDWGGVVVLGNALINVPGGSAQIEGGLLGPDAFYGGTNDDDSSGVLRYVRIEFPGIAYQPNNEINGLTMGGVGRKTVIENIQVSFSGDDAFEWFGGTVNGKYLITHRAWDDDFDTDFGFSGKIQFALSIRDAAIADQSQSNGFESDNDGTGTTNAPITSPLFSNVTIIGPKENGTPAALYRRAMHLRRNTRTSVYNSVFMGYPTGLHIDGSAAQGNATNNLMQLENVVLANMTNNFEQTSGANTWTGMDAYFNSASRGNQTYASTSSLGMAPGYNSLTNPALLPASGSILLSGASFSNTRLTDPFFMPVNHRGAFGTIDWSANWSNFDPQMTRYDLNAVAAIRHEPSGLSMDSTGVSSGVTQVRTNFNPGMGSDANFVRYRMGTGNWTIEPVTQLPMTLNLSAGMWEVQGGSRVMGAMYWTCSGFYRAAAVPVQRSVVFRVNMTNQTVGANGMYVAGNFQGWNATASPMVADAVNPNIYQYTALINANTTIEYKFVNSGVWESVPSNCAQNGNRFLTVVNDTILPAFVYGSCGLTPPTVSRTVTFAVNMGGQNISANGVHVAGSFQGFNPGSTPMLASTTNPGVYTYTTQIPDGVTIEYKYINGNSFATAEQVPAACGVTDGFGGYNRFAAINSDTTLPAYYFGTCSTVPPGAISGLVTYDNTASTIMTNTTVNLRSGSTVVATVNTGSTGTYTFPNVANGSYTLSFSTNKPWVGVNATDALRVAQFAAGQVTLAGIRFTAADVNNSNTVNNTDALQISQRTSQSRSSFTAGDWRFENPTIT
ncbi:MAG: hypothetical protein EBS53_09280, partial [Bacteroidetes bacterium]|nr:hypothetical protein [Bacteroidota bacterium]